MRFVLILAVVSIGMASFGATTQELLIQSWGIENYSQNLVRLFPGVSQTWPEASFDGLRAEGGYTVSARNEQGQTRLFVLHPTAIARFSSGLRVIVRPT